MSREFNDVKAGEDLGQYEYRLTPGRILKYVEATEDDCPWFQTESPFGGPIAPATIFDNDGVRPGLVRWRELRDKVQTNLLHAKQEYEFHNPALPGKKIMVRARFVRKYIKGKRTYVTYEYINTDEDGRELVHMRSTMCWLTT